MGNANLYDRLKIVRNSRSQKDFSEEYDLNPATYSKMESSGKFLNPQFLKNLNQKEDINLNWLITGKGTKYTSDFQINEPGAKYIHHKLPVIGKINSQTSKIQFFQNKKQLENIELIESASTVHINNITQNVELFEISGTHLHPKFHNHDILMIDKSIPIDKISKNAFGIFSVNPDIWIFRRYNNHNEICLLEPLNIDLNTLAITPQNLDIYGIAIHLFRKLH